MRNWLLPEYIQDILPPEAARLERARRLLLDLFRVHGYQLVVPPLLEYVESLLSGTGRDMELQLFKVVDQLSGRLMGVRADMTPQAARIDAHLLNRDGVTRLCYAGSVLHTRPGALAHTREPLQVGAEIYGHAGPESDVEIQQLMLKALALLGIRGVHLDLGHVAVFRALVNRGGAGGELESDLFRALQAKDAPLISELAAPLPAPVRNALMLLPDLYGGAEVLDKARHSLPAYPEIGRALDELAGIGTRLAPVVGQLCFDLAELRGYHYHTGAVFAAYAAGNASAVALGGRYDRIGLAFGRARPATGFSLDLREISPLLPAAEGGTAILAPLLDDPALQQAVEALRAKGEVVIVDLPGHETSRRELDCDRRLQFMDGCWQVVADKY